MIPRLQKWLKGLTQEPSMLTTKFWTGRIRECGLMMIIPDLVELKKVLFELGVVCIRNSCITVRYSPITVNNFTVLNCYLHKLCV